jgi:hypothetical protein
MTTVNEGGDTRLLRQATAAGATKTTTVEMTDLSGDFEALTHVFLGIKMFNSGGTQIVDTTGSFAITVKTVNTNYYESPPTATIDATAPTTINWAGNTSAIKVVPTGLTDTDNYLVVVTANRN